jgi:hypothetical protein
MGWQLIPWYTITDDFDSDFGVDGWHSHNAFFRDEDDRVYRTYFINNRGAEAMGTTWSMLDMTTLGRQEEWEDSPEGYPQTTPYRWWNYHDKYGETSSRATTCRGDVVRASWRHRGQFGAPVRKRPRGIEGPWRGDGGRSPETSASARASRDSSSSGCGPDLRRADRAISSRRPVPHPPVDAEAVEALRRCSDYGARIAYASRPIRADGARRPGQDRGRDRPRTGCRRWHDHRGQPRWTGSPPRARPPSSTSDGQDHPGGRPPYPPSQSTGGSDSKFGLPSEQAEEAIRRIRDSDLLHLQGVHLHIGSQILDAEPFAAAVRSIAEFGAFDCYDLGGGLGVRYTFAECPLSIDEYLEAIVSAARRWLPAEARLLIEPGRSIIGPAGVSLYRVVSVKRTGRTFVAVDGGMADNMDPALTGQRYEATIASKVDHPCGVICDVVGRHCESGRQAHPRRAASEPRSGRPDGNPSDRRVLLQHRQPLQRRSEPANRPRRERHQSTGGAARNLRRPAANASVAVHVSHRGTSWSQ